MSYVLNVKSENIKKHAARRLEQRVGLSHSHLKYIRSLICSKQSEFIRHISLARSLHRVTYEGQTFLVVYDKRRHLIVTVLYDREAEC